MTGSPDRIFNHLLQPPQPADMALPTTLDTPLPDQPPLPLPPPPQPAEPTKPLDVTDALSYLDLVKVQFENLPTTYNKFLDVMKDFKSSAIDTPGVIERVSTLFTGYPTLIQGFNTFLPPGYRIECSQDPSVIIVTTPSGISTRPPAPPATAIPTTNPPQEEIQHPGGPNDPLNPQSQSYQERSHPSPGSHQSLAPDPPPDVPQDHPANHHLADPRGPSPSLPPTPSPGLLNSASNAATVLGGMNHDTSPGLGQVTEFHHAMTYINRIKTRFADNQEVYKGFLQLLQAYQRGQMNIQEAYRQVAILFKDAEELLEEFKLFLPDTSQQAGVDGSNTMSLPAPSWQAYGGPADQDHRKRADAPSGQKRKRRQVDRDAPAARGAAGRQKKRQIVQVPSKPDHTSPPNSGFLVRGGSPIQGSGLTQATTAHPPTSDESIATFFEHLKHNMDDEEAYDEFLRVLDLFSMEILDADSLLERLSAFLAPDEIDRLIELLGWDEDKAYDENASEDAFERRRALAFLKQTLNAESVTRVGPSYRSCPVVETGLACSGRDELCRSVLNDRWESHPTWASEESGFISHKKNAFEEALYRGEEERYEYQFHIEAMARTLSLLEPLLRKLEETPIENLAGLRLPPNLGSPTPSIHQRIVKKIYGREAGLEIIQALQDAPAHALPVVVSRLRQKDEEWRRGQNEFSKMWRDVDTRNFYKSLDHQGITFKVNDKKGITTKSLVSQLESARATSLEQGTKMAYHLEFMLDDIDVVQDAMKLCLYALDRQPLSYSRFERKNIERFLRLFVPLLLMKDANIFDAVFETSLPSADEDDMESEGEVLNGEIDEGKGNINVEPLPRIDDTWVSCASQWDSFSAQENADSSERVLYTSTSIYVVIRLFQLLYSRLLIAKQVSRKLVNDKNAPWINNPVAVELGINDSSWSSTASAPTVQQEQDRSHFYRFLLNSVEKLMDGELEQPTFEDCARVTFGTEAYKLFTLDKVIGALNKQVQAVVCDGRGALLSLTEQSGSSQSNIQDRIRYRIRAHIMASAEETVYELTTKAAQGEVLIRLLRRSDATPGTSEERMYVESYVLDHPTQGLSQTPKVPYLRRCRACAGMEEYRLRWVKSGMAISIGELSKIGYEASGEDLLVHAVKSEQFQKACEQARARGEKCLRECYI